MIPDSWRVSLHEFIPRQCRQRRSNFRDTCDDEEAAAVVAEFSHEYLPELGDDDQPGVVAGVEV